MDELYHPRILELAAGIPHLGRLPAAQGSATKVSRICGSVVTVDVVLDGDRVSALAAEPKACALGQASTAILAAAAVGATVQEITEARDALRAMLKEGGPPPAGRFWELRHLSGVAGYPPRHASTLLAFEAAVAAIAAAQAAAAVPADV
jgi:NifU-like protein involved in Fe-S cluster formation